MKRIHYTSTYVHASLIVCTFLLGGCMVDMTGQGDDRDLDLDFIGESESELQNGTDTTGYAPVGRIQTSTGGLCTATVISDDVLATAAHCIKFGNSVRSWVKVRKAHGAIAHTQGRY